MLRLQQAVQGAESRAEELQGTVKGLRAELGQARQQSSELEAKVSKPLSHAPLVTSSRGSGERNGL